ncbi:MAG: radical SAM protein [Lentisphaerae bacterium]|nr:radical SAM protein [Lentisphaerota bacterium]MCP4102760.1 radical SAM protein [Lentisphaerota bacterium]
MSTFFNIHSQDNRYPESKTYSFLQKPENKHLLDYVCYDSFGGHRFPGNIPDYSTNDFIKDLNKSLKSVKEIHLWINIPVCSKRCFFCQFPTDILSKDKDLNDSKLSKWLDYNLKEAALWLEQVPHLRKVNIGEFNIFGGTPSLLSKKQIVKLITFYKDNFNFTENSTLRFEGNPSSFTKEKLEVLKTCGVTKLSCGIQSFNNDILRLANCPHDLEDIITFSRNVNEIGFDWVSGDLIYGLVNQEIHHIENDIAQAVDLGFTGLVCSKLHLKTFSEAGTAVSGKSLAAWQSNIYREKMAAKGYVWPSIAEQYQMRDVIVQAMAKHGFLEHPTMYFYRKDKSPERWKSLMIDQDKQYPEVSLGLGGSSSCIHSEAVNITEIDEYINCIDAGNLPIASVKGFTDDHKIVRSIKMALSSCTPLSDDIHTKNFPDSSLFNNHWLPVFESLENRGLATVNTLSKSIELTEEGQNLVEAIINTEIQ